MYYAIQLSIQVLTPLSGHEWMHVWPWSTITQVTKQGGCIHTSHTTPKGCLVCTWVKTEALLSSALDGIWCNMSPNYPYRCWHPPQLINVHTGHTTPQGCTVGGWMETEALSPSVLDSVWCIMSFNHPCRYWHPSQFINGCKSEIVTPLHRQPNRGITYILATQHSEDGPAWIEEKWHASCSCLGWLWCTMRSKYQYRC